MFLIYNFQIFIKYFLFNFFHKLTFFPNQDFRHRTISAITFFLPVFYIINILYLRNKRTVGRISMLHSTTFFIYCRRTDRAALVINHPTPLKHAILILSFDEDLPVIVPLSQLTMKNTFFICSNLTILP